MVTRFIGDQVVQPFLEPCVANDKIVSDSKIKDSTTFLVTLTISEATMDFFKTSSSGSNMAIPVTTWDQHLTERDLGNNCVQLVIEKILFSCRSAGLGSVDTHKCMNCLTNDEFQDDNPVRGPLNIKYGFGPLLGKKDTNPIFLRVTRPEKLGL